MAIVPPAGPFAEFPIESLFSCHHLACTHPVFRQQGLSPCHLRQSQDLLVCDYTSNMSFLHRASLGQRRSRDCGETARAEAVCLCTGSGVSRMQLLQWYSRVWYTLDINKESWGLGRAHTAAGWVNKRQMLSIWGRSSSRSLHSARSLKNQIKENTERLRTLGNRHLKPHHCALAQPLGISLPHGLSQCRHESEQQFP